MIRPRYHNAMAKDEKTYSDCCHEAGHALLRYLRGDTLLRLIIDPSFSGGEVQLGLGVRGTCDSRAKERICVCGGYVRNEASSLPYGTRSQISLDPTCSDCTDNVVTHLASIYAGSRATKLLTPVEHDERDAQFDDKVIEEFFRDLACLAPQRISLKNRAKRLAINTILRESQAIHALAEALQGNAGTLDGASATDILAKTVRYHSLSES